MSAVLSEAETKFFSSRGQDVDPSLKPAEPASAGPTGPTGQTTPPAQTTPAAATPPAANGGQQPLTAEPPAAPQQVPLGALHEERKARQKAEQERQQLQQQIQQFQATIEQLQKAQQPAPPDPQQDPIGYMIHQGKLNQQQLEQIEQWRNQQDQYTQQIVARQQFHQSITNAEQAFAAKNPDYWQAASYAQQQYDKMLAALIPDPTQRRQRVIQEAMNAAWSVMQEGRDPAEFFYKFAKDMGYAGPQSAAVPAMGAQPPVAPQVQQTVPEVVKTIERGLKQQANPGGGATPNSEITPEMALALPGEDFNKWWAKQFRR